MNYSGIIYERNLQTKVKNILASEIMNEVFKLNGRSYNTRINSNFQHTNTKTVSYGSATFSSLDPEIWGLIPPEYTIS